MTNWQKYFNTVTKGQYPCKKKTLQTAKKNDGKKKKKQRTQAEV